MEYEFQKKHKVPVTFYIDSKLSEKIKLMATEENRSMSNTVVHIIKKYFDDVK